MLYNIREGFTEKKKDFSYLTNKTIKKQKSFGTDSSFEMSQMGSDVDPKEFTEQQPEKKVYKPNCTLK